MKKKKIDIINILLFLIISIIIFVSNNTQAYTGWPIKELMHKYFMEGILFHERFLSILDILILWLCFILEFRYKGFTKKKGRKYNILIFATVITIFFKIINPNNSVPGNDLYTIVYRMNDFILLFLLIELFALRPIVFYHYFIKNAGKYFIYLSLSKIGINAILYLVGYPEYFANYIPSTLSEMDGGLFIAFTHSIFFFLYLSTKKNKYLIVLFFILVFQILTIKRTGLSLSLITDILLYIFYIKNNITKLMFPLTFLTLIFIFTLESSVLKENAYIQTFTVLFTGEADNVIRGSNDGASGHFDQTSTTFNQIGNLPFWGIGYGKKMEDINLEGAAHGGTLIHNVYAYMHYYYGFYALLWLVLPILFIVSAYIKILFKSFTNLRLLEVLFIAYLIGYYISISFTTVGYFESTQFYFFIFTCFTAVFKLRALNRNDISINKIN